MLKITHLDCLWQGLQPSKLGTNVNHIKASGLRCSKHFGWTSELEGKLFFLFLFLFFFSSVYLQKFAEITQSSNA
jgi:hypothetical protein